MSGILSLECSEQILWDIGEMQWNRVSSRPSWYRTCFVPGTIHCVHLLFFGYQFLNISDPKLCLRTFVWKWGHTRHHGTGLICYVKLRSRRVFSFELKEQMLRIGLCVIHFFASDVNAMDQMLHLQHHGTDLCLEAACGSWKACVPSGTECNWRKLICSTVRLERLFVTNMQNQYVRLERLFVTNMQNQ